MDNWLFDLSGLPGCWFPMDYMQEHSIRELKKKSQRRDEAVEGDFSQDVISRNVQHFVEARTIINASAGLRNRSAAHVSTNSLGAATQLRKALETGCVHYFFAGRSHGWRARGDFMAAFEKMPSKLQRSLRDTLLILGNVQASPAQDMHSRQPDQYDTNNAAQSDSEEGPDELGEQGVPVLVMVFDGRIVVEAPEAN
ncbi:hypothetical protein FRC12_017120 [Ceratobasidium sp. 428]|nr:hypothetical protein FRC12_017120 [Ceratobasidium sp. 428]